MRVHAAVSRTGRAPNWRLPLVLLAWLFPLALSAQTLTIVSGNNQTLVPTQVSQPLVVRATDAQGAPLTGATIEWSSSNATAGFAATTQTDSKGESTNRLTAVLPGNYTLNAEIVGAQNGANVNFIFVNGVANLGALTPVQAAVGHAIDVACPALATSQTPISSQQTDFLQRCSEIVVNASSSAVPAALDAMASNKTQPQSQMASNVQISQSSNLDARMSALRLGATGINLGGLAVANNGKSVPLAMLGDAFHKDPAQGGEVGGEFSRWGFFANGMISNGSFAANESRPGFDYDGASLTAGFDYRFSDAFVAGIAFGYNHDKSDLDLNSGKIDGNGYSLNGYMTWYHGNDFYVQAAVEFTKLDFDLSRNIIYQIAALGAGGGTTSVNQVARASPDGDLESLNVTVGHDFNNGAFAFSPYLRGAYAHLSLDGFTESIDSNAPGFGLATQVDSRSKVTEIGTIGSLFSYTSSQNWGVLVPNARLEYSHDFRTDPQTVVSRFVSDPTQTLIVVTDPRLDHNFYEVGFGLNAVWPQGRSGYIAYEYIGGLTGAHLNRFEAGFRIEF